MNKVMLMGRLTADPEIRYTQANPPMCVARYSLAIKRQFKKPGEPDVDYFSCVAFEKKGEFAEKYLKKGMLISVVGHLQNNKWTDNQNVEHRSTNVVIEEQHFAEAKKTSNTPSNEVPYDPTLNPPSGSAAPFVPTMEDDDDLPF